MTGKAHFKSVLQNEDERDDLSRDRGGVCGGGCDKTAGGSNMF